MPCPGDSHGGSLERLNTEVDRSVEQLRDHERRLTRIETMIEIARANRAIPPNSPVQ